MSAPGAKHEEVKWGWLRPVGVCVYGMETSGAGLEATSGKLSVPDVPHEAGGRPGMSHCTLGVNDIERMVAAFLNMSNIFLQHKNASKTLE